MQFSSISINFTPAGVETYIVESASTTTKGKSELTLSDEPRSQNMSVVSPEEKPDIFKIEAAASLMRKSLNNSDCDGPSWLLFMISESIAEPVPELEMHGFIFENSMDAAQ